MTRAAAAAPHTNPAASAAQVLTIGKTKLEAAAPDAERLLAGTGLSVEEMRRQLDGPCHAGTLAAAIEACMPQPLSRVELAELIAAEGADKARPKVQALYGKA